MVTFSTGFRLPTSFGPLGSDDLNEQIEDMKIEIESSEDKEAAIDKQIRHLKQVTSTLSS